MGHSILVLESQSPRWSYSTEEYNENKTINQSQSKKK